jgi:hypothetical protein
MKKPEYSEGRVATENFEQGMKALFKVPKDKIKASTMRTPKSSSVRKTKHSDKD